MPPGSKYWMKFKVIMSKLSNILVKINAIWKMYRNFSRDGPMAWVVSPKLIHWCLNPQCPCTGGEAFREAMREHPAREMRRRCSTFSLQHRGEARWGTRREPTIHKPGKGVSPDTKPAAPWSWTSSLENCEKIKFCVISCLVGILLQHPHRLIHSGHCVSHQNCWK